MSEDHERFVRWQKVAIDQLGYTLNLVFTFTLTIAGLGYCFALLRDKDFNPSPSAKSFLTLSLIALAVAAVSGDLCIVNRLRDFRGTARHCS
jgi:hypothetical protein